MPSTTPRRIALQNKPEKARRRPLQGRSRATVTAILEAATRILQLKGEAALTTNAVAETAGVSIGSLYAYFPDRAAILTTLAEQLLDSDERAIAAALDLPGDPIRNLVTALVTVHMTNRSLRRILLDRHIRAGHAAFHAERAQAAIGALAARLPAAASTDPLRYFIATRATLGVCRALTHAETPPAAERVVAELLHLISAYLAPSPMTEPLDARPARL